MLGLIWAQAQHGVIGAGGRMPWHLPEDLAHFKRVTVGHPVVMGRRTWESIDPRFRPLVDRRNIVVSRDRSWSAEGAEAAHSVDEALALAVSAAAEVWVIGGAQLYAATIGRADRLEVTEIDVAVPGDAFAPAIGREWTPDPAPAPDRTSAPDPTPAPTPAPAPDPDAWRESAAGLRYRFRRFRRP